MPPGTPARAIRTSLTLGGPLFTLNGFGYLALAGAYLIAAVAPISIVQRFSWLPRTALAGYAVVTIGAYLLRIGWADAKGRTGSEWCVTRSRAFRGLHRLVAETSDTNILEAVVARVVAELEDADGCSAAIAPIAVQRGLAQPTTTEPWSTGSATDTVADVGGVRRVDHSNDFQLDSRRQHLEQPTPTTEQHRDLADLQLV